MVNRKKLIQSQRLAQRRTKQHIKSAEQRVSEYRALVSEEGIQSRRLEALDTAKEAYRSKSERDVSKINHLVDIKRSQRNKKQWHHKENAMRKEWKCIYQSMQSNYTSVCDDHFGSARSFRAKKENFIQGNTESHTAKSQRSKKLQRRVTCKGQPIMCDKIAEIYAKCMP